MKRLVVVVLLSVSLLVVPAAAQTTNTAVVAGQSVGTVRIGGNISDAVAAFGVLYDRDDADKYHLYDWPLRPFFVIAEKEGGKIVLILIHLSDAYKTDKGSITAGTERASVEVAYGKEFAPDEDDRSLTMIYDPQGIAFDIAKSGVMSGRVARIIVFVPGQWKQITGGI